MSEVPEVTLRTQDGREVRCTLHRDPEHDRPEGDPRGQVTYYRAVPDQKVALGTFEVECVKPPRTGFWLDIPRAGLETLMSRYSGPAQHTFTPACDGLHEAGPCPAGEK